MEEVGSKRNGQEDGESGHAAFSDWEAPAERIRPEVPNALHERATTWVVRFRGVGVAGRPPPQRVIASGHDTAATYGRGTWDVPAARDRRGTWHRVRRPSRARVQLPPRQSN